MTSRRRVGKGVPSGREGSPGRGALWEGGEPFGREGSPLGGRGALWEGGEPFGREGSPLGGRGALWEGGEPFGREGASAGRLACSPLMELVKQLPLSWDVEIRGMEQKKRNLGGG